MRFLSKSLSALLAILFIFLASTFLSSQTYAKESSKNEDCPMSQFLITSGKSCNAKPKSNQAEEFLPTQKLIPAKLPGLPAGRQVKPKENKQKIQTSNFTSRIDISEPAVEATLSADTLFTLVNQHREALGLSNFQKDPQVCFVAESRRNQIRNEVFVTHLLHSGFYALNLPFWATENMIYQHTEKGALNWWLNSPIHKAAIEGNYKYACGVCNGEVCNMVFTNFEPKAETVFEQSFNNSLAQAPAIQANTN